MKNLKTFESFSSPNKIEVNGIEISLVKSPFDNNYEMYFKQCDEVINLGEDEKFAQSVLSTAKFLAEDGKKAKDICNIIKDKLKKF